MARCPTLEQLRVLVAVADTGTMSAAARRLGRAQPAITQSIQAVEAALGVAVFDRSAKAIEMTPAGRALVETARTALAAADAVRDQAEVLSSEVETELAIAAEGSVPKAILMDSLKAVGKAFPDLPLAVFTESLGGAEQLLRNHKVQVALYAPSTAYGLDVLTGERLATLPVVAAVADGHPLAAETGAVQPSVLHQHIQLVMRDRGREMAPINGSIISGRTWVFSDFDTRLSSLLAGCGWAHMPLHMIDEHLAAGRLKRLEFERDEGRFRSMDLWIFHAIGRPPGRAGRLFTQELRRRFRSAVQTASPGAPADENPRGERDVSAPGPALGHEAPQA